MAYYPIVLGNTSLTGSSRNGALPGSFSLDYNKDNPDQSIIFEAKTPTNLKVVYSAVLTFAKNNGLTIPPKEQIRKENGLNGDLLKPGVIIRIVAGRTPGTACVPVSPGTVEHSAPPAGPVYNPHSLPTSLVESNQPHRMSSASDIEQQRSDYARRIFDTLVKAGTIRADTKFEGLFGFLGGLDQDIAGLISDRDSDGHFDFDTAALRDLLEVSGVLADPTLKAGVLGDKLAAVAGRYFDEKLDGNPPAPAGANEPGTRSRPLAEFEKYIATTYRGRLCGDPAARAAYVKDIKEFMAAHFTGTIEHGVEIDVDDKFVATPETVEKYLSRDKAGRYRADCGVYAQVYKRLFAAAGLATEYYGTYIQPKGYAAGNHLQAVGYLPNEKFILVNNNEGLSRHNMYKLPGTAEGVVVETLRAAYPSGLTVLEITDGKKTQNEVLVALAPSKLKWDTQVALGKVVAALERLEAERNKALAKNDGQVNYERLRATLDSLHNKVVLICEKIDNFGPAILPLTLQVGQSRQEKTFRTSEELKAYIEGSLQGKIKEWQGRFSLP
jgi:hypothetical protein